jgi:hypothetical protein
VLPNVFHRCMLFSMRSFWSEVTFCRVVVVFFPGSGMLLLFVCLFLLLWQFLCLSGVVACRGRWWNLACLFDLIHATECKHPI